jgi:UDP-2,3-diacylglucosamine hydrolase
MIDIILPKNKKIYFASDFHLGALGHTQSLLREKQICRWLNESRGDMEALFLVGDVFDFWFEYRKVVPRGFVRLLGKLAEIRDSGIPIYFFPGNHDMWVTDYFEEEMGFETFRKPQTFRILQDEKSTTFYLTHGDGYGPGDVLYKQVLKRFFESSVSRFLFRWLHPDIGMWLGNTWAKQSRMAKTKHGAEVFEDASKEWLLSYAQSIEATQHFDYYVFGHRHLPLDLEVSPAGARYVNLGEWVFYKTFATFDGQTMQLHSHS